MNLLRKLLDIRLELLGLFIAKVDFLGEGRSVERLLKCMSLTSLLLHFPTFLYILLKERVDCFLLGDGLDRVLLDEEVQGLHQPCQVVWKATLYTIHRWTVKTPTMSSSSIAYLEVFPARYLRRREGSREAAKA